MVLVVGTERVGWETPTDMKTYVLYRPEREQRVLKALEDAGIPDAILHLGPPPVTPPPTCGLKPGEYACWVGHKEIVALAALSEEPILVLEDDFLPIFENWQERVEGIIQSADRRWDYINLGRYLTLGGMPTWLGVEESFSLTTHAYLLSPYGAKRYLQAMPEPTTFPLDWLPNKLKAFGQLDYFTASPRLFRQDREGCPGLIHQEAESSEFWPPTLKLPFER
jgi:hypothetical protein